MASSSTTAKDTATVSAQPSPPEPATEKADDAHDETASATRPLESQDRSPSQLGRPLHQTRTTASVIHSRVTKIPPPNGRWDPEFEVTWDGPNDPECPYNWSPVKRWWAVLFGALLTLNASFASSAPSENIPQYIAYFGISQEVATLTVSLFLCGYIAGPLAWGALSENFGRRIVFIASFLPYVAWNVGCALSKNTASILVFRFLAGCFAACPLAISGAVVADTLPAETRGLGMALFAIAPFAGPALGPIVGGFIQVTGTSWRWTYWTITIFSGVCAVVLVLAMPETYSPYLLQQKARKLRKETGSDEYWAPLDRREHTFKALCYDCLVAPWKMLFEEPMLLVITLYLSFVYGLLYGNFASLPIIMAQVHGFSAGIVGLTFTPLFLGGVVGVIANVVYYNPLYIKDVARYKPRRVPPERRLLQAMVGGTLLPISMFWMGWTGQYRSVSYWNPLLSVGLLGVSVVTIFLPMFSYLTDCYLASAATALSINTVVRSGFGAAFPLFTTQMFHKLGINGACSLFGGLAILGVAIPFALYRFGPRIRAMSKHAVDLDGPGPAPAAAAEPEEEEKKPKDLEEGGAPFGPQRTRTHPEQPTWRVRGP